MRTSVSSGAGEQARWVRNLTDLPIALGFGVSNGEQAGAVAAYADGVIVGSAIVKAITDHLPDYRPAVAPLVRELADATHATG